MEKVDKGLIIEKRFEFILGLFMSLPSINGVVLFLYHSMAKHWYEYHHNIIHKMLSQDHDSIYWGIMSFLGVYLIKNSFRYFFVQIPKTFDNTADKVNKETEEKDDNLLKG